MDLMLVVVLVAGAGALLLIAFGAVRPARRHRAARRRAEELHDRFGPEYDRMVALVVRDRGEHALVERLDRYAELDHPKLGPAARQLHTERWRQLQFPFVDAPDRSVREAEHLVVTLMDARGFPTDDAVVRAALSVDDPELADSSRAAHRALPHAKRGRPRHEPTTFVGTVPDGELESIAAGAGPDRR
jgi:hypothetical protein